MIKRLSVIGFVLFVSLFTVLSGNAHGSKPVNIYDCFDEKTFQYTGGKYNNAEINYRLHSPENIRHGRKYPLIVHLHGIGEAGADNTHSLLHLHSIFPVLTGPESEDFFMLVTQCPRETPGWSFRPSQDGTLDVLVAVPTWTRTDKSTKLSSIKARFLTAGRDIVRKILQKHGWKHAGQRGDNDEKWQRPGTNNGHSAYLHITPPVFYPFSTNSHPFESENPYNYFAVYTILEHGGDFSAAARELTRLGYGDAFTTEPVELPEFIDGTFGDYHEVSAEESKSRSCYDDDDCPKNSRNTY